MTWAVFGNQWPSRSGGQFESAAYRAVAGKTLAFFHQRVLEVHGADTPVLAMGDFNDEPFNVSLTAHALSTRQRSKVLNAIKAPLLWNLMGPVIVAEDGTDAEGADHRRRVGDDRDRGRDRPKPGDGSSVRSLRPGTRARGWSR